MLVPPPDRDTTELRGPLSQPRPTDPIGSIGWTERTGGVLTARECLTLARPLLRGELSILAGRLAMVLRMHSGRRSSIDPASLVPPDSPLARDAEDAAQDLLTPALLNHSSRAYTWGAAIAALHGIRFDRELLYLAAMFHDTGIPSPVPDVDFTVRSAAWHASSPTATACLPISASSSLTRSPCTTPPALASNPVPRPTSFCRRVPRCVRPSQQRDTRCNPPERHRRVPAPRFQAGVRRASPGRGQASPSWPRLVPAPLRHEGPQHSARALPRLM